MGKRGPAPTPKEILRRRGSWYGNAKPGEVQPPPLRPRRPNWLDDIGRYAWEQAVDQLCDLGLLSGLDSNAIARYARVYSEWRKAADFLATHGQAYHTTGADGKPDGFYLFPQAKFFLALSDRLLRLEQQFGMTPASRVNLQAPEAPPAAVPGRVPMQAPAV